MKKPTYAQLRALSDAAAIVLEMQDDRKAPDDVRAVSRLALARAKEKVDEALVHAAARETRRRSRP